MAAKKGLLEPVFREKFLINLSQHFQKKGNEKILPCSELEPLELGSQIVYTAIIPHLTNGIKIYNKLLLENWF